MAVKQVIKRKVAMAWLRSDDSRGQPSIHSVKYRKLDHTIGYKAHISKSFRHLSGASRFKGDMKEAHALFIREPRQAWRVNIPYITGRHGAHVHANHGKRRESRSFLRRRPSAGLAW